MLIQDRKTGHLVGTCLRMSIEFKQGMDIGGKTLF